VGVWGRDDDKHPVGSRADATSAYKLGGLLDRIAKKIGA